MTSPRLSNSEHLTKSCTLLKPCEFDLLWGKSQDSYFWAPSSPGQYIKQQMGLKNSCFEMTIPIFTSNRLQLNPLGGGKIIHYSVEQIFTCYHDSRTKYTQKSLILIHLIFKWICEHRTTILSIQKSLILQNATILKEDHQSNRSKNRYSLIHINFNLCNLPSKWICCRKTMVFSIWKFLIF